MATIGFRDTAEPLRLEYDATNYVQHAVDSAGVLTITPTGKTVKLGSAALTVSLTLEPTATDRVLRFSNPSGDGGGGFEFYAADALYAQRVFKIRNDGNVGILTDEPLRPLHVTGKAAFVTGTQPESGWSTYLPGGLDFILAGDDAIGGGTIYACSHANNAGDSVAEFTGYRARGTHAVPLDNVAGDLITKYGGVARTLGTWQQAAYIQLECDDGWGADAGDAPGRIRFNVSPDGGFVPETALLISSTKDSRFYGYIGYGVDPSVPLDMRADLANYALDIRNANASGAGVSIIAGSGSGTVLGVNDSAANPVLKCLANGSVQQGPGALATTATDGFFYISTVSGTPTNTPTASTGRVAMVYDDSADKLWIYRGAWRSATFA